MLRRGTRESARTLGLEYLYHFCGINLNNMRPLQPINRIVPKKLTRHCATVAGYIRLLFVLNNPSHHGSRTGLGNKGLR
jgi:hypothetical protein